MERKFLSNNLKRQSIGERSIKDNNNNKKGIIKDSWNYSSSASTTHQLGGDLLSGFSWPPRSYTCSFCQREFRSAQALGGHMNVHRRDRARLRQYSPPRDDNTITTHDYPHPNLNLNLDPNPNPNPNPNQNPENPSSSQLSSSAKFPPFTTTLPTLVSSSLLSLSSPSCASPSEIKKWVLDKGSDFSKNKSSKTLFGVGEFKAEVVKKGEIARLDLEIGLIRDSKEDLDLELRLGRS